MRVAGVVPYLGCGGTEQRLLRLGRGLRELGHEFALVATEYPGEWFARAADAGIPAVCLAGPGRIHPVRHAWRVGRYLRQGGFDAVMLNNAERFAQASLAMLPATTAAIPVVRSDNPHAYTVACSNARHWNVLVAVSPRTAREAQSRVPEKPVRLILNGIDPAPVEARRHRPGHALPLRLLYVGRLEHRPKGVLRLPAILDAARRRGLQVRLTCVGDGCDRDRLVAEARERGVSDLLTLAGAQPPDAVYGRLLNAHVLLMPSFFEGLPGAPLEAQACGCVPVAARLPGVSDAVIRDGETGMLVEGDAPDAYAAALARLHDDPALWQRMSAAGTAEVHDRFSAEAMVRAYDALLAEWRAGAFARPRPRGRLCPVRATAFRWWEWIPSHWRPWSRRRGHRRPRP